MCSVPNLVLSDDAKETVRSVCDSGGEEDAVGEWQKIPQAIKLEQRSIGPHERLDEIAADRIVIVDEPIPKLPTQKLITLYQSKFHQTSDTVRDQAPEEVAAGIEHVYEATASTMGHHPPLCGPALHM